MHAKVTQQFLARDNPEVFYAVLLQSFHYRYNLGLSIYILFTVFVLIRE